MTPWLFMHNVKIHYLQPQKLCAVAIPQGNQTKHCHASVVAPEQTQNEM